jgi:hypothetical protein
MVLPAARLSLEFLHSTPKPKQQSLSLAAKEHKKNFIRGVNYCKFIKLLYL